MREEMVLVIFSCMEFSSKSYLISCRHLEDFNYRNDLELIKQPLTITFPFGSRSLTSNTSEAQNAEVITSVAEISTPVHSTSVMFPLWSLVRSSQSWKQSWILTSHLLNSESRSKLILLQFHWFHCLKANSYLQMIFDDQTFDIKKIMKKIILYSSQISKEIKWKWNNFV